MGTPRFAKLPSYLLWKEVRRAPVCGFLPPATSLEVFEKQMRRNAGDEKRALVKVFLMEGWGIILGEVQSI